jgi:ribosomal protein S18 acetylase RimI-like enzyme
LTEGYLLRAAGPGDVSRVLELWREARTAHASTPDRAEELERLVSTAPGSVLVAESDGAQIVGALIAAWDGWRGNMYRLAVLGEHRRRGIGMALVRGGEAYLREHGARHITALVAYDDEVAGTFWEHAGYPRDREIGRRVRNLQAPAH